MPSPRRTLRLGAIGLGRAFTIMLPGFIEDDRVQLVAATDPRADARRRFAVDFNARAYESAEALCADPNVDAVYIATPHELHVEHVRIAAARGKHILVEKPMAITLADCTAMIESARGGGVHLIVGHSHSFNAPVLRARALIDSGMFGAVRMIHMLNYTDFMYRPRRPEELITARGGGVVFSQAAHQVDIARLLGGGKVKSVRAATGSWDPVRPSEGAYSALLTFADGAYASLTYNGYGRFDSDEFTGWIGEMGLPKDRSRYGAGRKALRNVGDAAAEIELKAARNYGGAAYTPSAPSPQRQHQHFGFMLVSCEGADLRLQPDGVMIYGDSEVKLDAVAVRSLRAEVIDELYDAVVHDRAPLHSGEWGRATVEVCLAILASAREGADIALAQQVALPASLERLRA